VHRDGKVGVLHLATDRLGERAVDAGGAVDREVAAGQKRGHEERQALDVVGMRVRQEQVEPERSLGRERQP